MYGRPNISMMRSFRQDPSVTQQKLKPGTVRRIITYAKPYKLYLALFLVATIIDSFITVVNPLLLRVIIDNGIILTGGTSQLRQMPELVFRRTGVKARVAKDAPYCVAKGTGEALKHLETYKKAIISKR